MATGPELKVYSKTMLYKLMLIRKRAKGADSTTESALDDLISELKASMEQDDVIRVENEVAQR